MTAPKHHEQIERLLAFSFANADVLIELDANLRVVFASGAVESLLGRVQKELLSLSFWDMLAPAERAAAKYALANLVSQTRMPFVDIALMAPNGRYIAVTLSAYRLDRPEPHYFLTIRRRSAAKEEMEALARADRQTGLMAESDFSDAAIRIEASHQGAQLTMLDLGDLDGFAGRVDPQGLDGALMQVGLALKAASIDCRLASRLSAGKMGLLHEAKIDIAAVRRRVEEIGRSVDPTGVGLKIRECTLPLSDAGLDPGDKSEVLRYAIRRFAEEGLDGFQAASMSDVLRSLVRDTVSRLENVRETIVGKSIEIAYQPIVRLGDRRVHHWEALSRPVADASPAKIVRFAEQIGLSHEFDLLVCSKVLLAIEAAEKRGLKPVIAVNLSANSLQNELFLESFCELTKARLAVRGQLMIEITETAELHDLAAADKIITELRRLGHKVCLDDFGTGAAGFPYVQALTVDCVKIDGGYVKNIVQNPRDTAIVRAVTKMCAEIGVEVVAEMIETETQANLLSEMGVELGQGFLFGKPKVDEDFSQVETARPALNLRRKGFVETWR